MDLKYKKDVFSDYKLVCESRQVSLMGRKEVFAGRAKFGVFGDGKELAQVVMAKFFKNGDFKAGYYRDQTFSFAIQETTIQQYFAQLYAHADTIADPSSGGRGMNCHFGSRLIDDNGIWRNALEHKNESSDVSSVAGQMPRMLGLAYASKLFRKQPSMQKKPIFSNQGNEVAFGTIGNGGCAEGVFWETVNASCVLQVPLVISVWDDKYSISVDNSYQVSGGCISSLLKGFTDQINYPFQIQKAAGWDYEALIKAYSQTVNLSREQHIPAVIHVTEMTQPQGHSTSGSHERYKSKERLEWEAKYDCLPKFKSWILENELATKQELQDIEKEAIQTVKTAKKKAWKEYQKSIFVFKESLQTELEQYLNPHDQKEADSILSSLKQKNVLSASAVYSAARRILYSMRNESSENIQRLSRWLNKAKDMIQGKYHSHLYSESDKAAIYVKAVAPIYDYPEKEIYGFEIMNALFDAVLEKYPEIFIIGQDVGKLGDVNQGLAGMQKKYGAWRVTDTGIREATQIGQGIGAAMRGLRPIIEIQYLDYIYYGLTPIADDLCSLSYRTAGGQKAPMIIRTRGHRLEGIWHSGSPMSMLLGALRGIYLITPRNMTQAAGFYNTILKSDDSALIIETLNTYRNKEKVIKNIGNFTIPLGVPEVLREGTDITVVTYGAMCSIVLQATEQLLKMDISCEVIDVQTLLPFDINHMISKSVKKNKSCFIC